MKTITPHPEIGILTVFGHEETRENQIQFGKIKDNKIKFFWKGIGDVGWNEKYGLEVPFDVNTKLSIKNV